MPMGSLNYNRLFFFSFRRRTTRTATTTTTPRLIENRKDQHEEDKKAADFFFHLSPCTCTLHLLSFIGYIRWLTKTPSPSGSLLLNNTSVYFRYRYIIQLKINKEDDAKQKTTSNIFGNQCAKKLLYVFVRGFKIFYRDEPVIRVEKDKKIHKSQQHTYTYKNHRVPKTTTTTTR